MSFKFSIQLYHVAAVVVTGALFNIEGGRKDLGIKSVPNVILLLNNHSRQCGILFDKGYWP